MGQRLAKVHQPGADGLLQPNLEFEVAQDLELEAGGRGLYGTLGGLMKFVRMIWNGGKLDGVQVLKPETVHGMSQNQMSACNVGPLKSASPLTSNDGEFLSDVPKKWGFVLMINMKQAPTGSSPGSLAWASLANTCCWTDPAKGVGSVHLFHMLPFVDSRYYPLV